MILMIFESYQLYIILSGIIAVIFLILSLKTKNKYSVFFFCLFSILFVFILFFFRNPSRNIIINENVILSPCDGKVISINKSADNRTQVYVFLSIFDVHRFRNPVAGKVLNTNYKKGKFNAAFDFKKSANENESNEVTYENSFKEVIKIRQIAGLIARRIICHIKTGDTVKQGNLYGLISFGSGCLIDIPSNYSLKIDQTSRIKAGETIIAERTR